ncbi:MAG: hypothetical protein R6U98_22340, partial [Pirellulaceae bacterium]
CSYLTPNNAFSNQKIDYTSKKYNERINIREGMTHDGDIASGPTGIDDFGDLFGVKRGGQD